MQSAKFSYDLIATVQFDIQGLQHEGKISMRERIAQSQVYGEQYRASQSGPDQRAAVKPLHPEKSDSSTFKDEQAK